MPPEDIQQQNQPIISNAIVNVNTYPESIHDTDSCHINANETYDYEIQTKTKLNLLPDQFNVSKYNI